MKPHSITKTFQGSQTGTDGPFTFEAGSVADLSDSLAEIAVKEGWAKPAKVEDRETKVVEPEETKPAKKGKKEGVA